MNSGTWECKQMPNFVVNEDLCKSGKEYLNDLLCKFGPFCLQHSKTFDISHAFLRVTVAELSTLKQVQFFWPTLQMLTNCTGLFPGTFTRAPTNLVVGLLLSAAMMLGRRRQKSWLAQQNSLLLIIVIHLLMCQYCIVKLQLLLLCVSERAKWYGRTSSSVGAFSSSWSWDGAGEISYRTTARCLPASVHGHRATTSEGEHATTQPTTANGHVRCKGDVRRTTKSADRIGEPWHTADSFVCYFIRYQLAQQPNADRKIILASLFSASNERK